MPETTVSVEYLGLIQNVLGIEREEYCLPSGSTVGALLQMLLAQHGKPLGDCVFKADGQLRPVVEVYVNNCPVQALKGLETPLAGESKLSVIVGVQPDPGG